MHQKTREIVPWDEIDTVFLDMDGTLLDLAYDNYFWHEYVPHHYGAQNNVDFEYAKQILIEKYKSKEGTLDWYCIDYWSAELQLDILQLKKNIVDRIQVFPGVFEFLQALQASDKALILLTNAHLGGVRIKLDHTRLGSLFHGIVSSHSIGFAKESESFWPKLREIQVFECESTLLIDDNLHVLRAAKKHGLRHLLGIHRPDSTKPAQVLDGFNAISGFYEIMPAE